MNAALPVATGETGVTIEFRVEAGNWPARARLRRLAERAIGTAAARAGRGMAGQAELSLLFTDDVHMRDLNRRFRGRDKPTNVLSLPAAPTPGGRIGPLLGDIVLSAETIDREARALGLDFDAHLTHLIVHGFLHLLGHDHQTEREALVMEGLETAILADLGIPDPYAA